MVMVLWVLVFSDCGDFGYFGFVIVFLAGGLWDVGVI